MKRALLKKIVSLSFTTLLILLFTGITISLADKVSKSGDLSVHGTIQKIYSDKGQVEVKNESGKMFLLTAGTDTDLTIFKKGDRVIIVYGKDKVIKSILR